MSKNKIDKLTGLVIVTGASSGIGSTELCAALVGTGGGAASGFF